MSTSDALKVALTELAIVRSESVFLNIAMHAAREAFNVEYAALLAGINAHAARLKSAEALVRALALVAFGADPKNKTPVEGVAIKVGTVREYDQVKVLVWAREHRATFPALIVETLNEKVLKALITANAVPGVTTKEEPTATIATDLSQYLCNTEPALVAVDSYV